MKTEWMVDAMCPYRADLPWLADADQTSEWERLAMARVCLGCSALAACRVFISVENISGGFWAGHHRDTAAGAMDADAGGPAGSDQLVLPGLSDAA